MNQALLGQENGKPDNGSPEESSYRHIEPESVVDDMDLHTRQQKPSLTTISIILVVTILGFTIQTEATAYYQEVLGWPKPFCSLYLTHSCLILPWLAYQLISPRSTAQRSRSWLGGQAEDVAELASSADAYVNRGTGVHDQIISRRTSLQYLFRTMAIVTAVLTVSGVSWFSALAWTTPSDLTVIYNCSAFFAAIFSVPLLNQQLTRNVVLAVALSFAGTLMIAYGSGDSTTTAQGSTGTGGTRVFGNLVAVVGACAYGLYCVLFKKWTTSTRLDDATSSLKMTFAASGMTGLYTLSLFWIVLLALHVLGIETLSLPSAQVCFYLLISVIPGSVSMTFVLVLTAWTNPVFGSVTSILCVFFIAIADWILFGTLPTLATYTGGALIFFAFGLLSWDEFAK